MGQGADYRHAVHVEVAAAGVGGGGGDDVGDEAATEEEDDAAEAEEADETDNYHSFKDLAVLDFALLVFEELDRSPVLISEVEDAAPHSKCNLENSNQ